MSRSIARLAACALLVIMLARMLHAAILLSPVVDEQSHISRGLSALCTGDLRLRIGHPIGLNVWEALPLALDPAVRLPLEHESWANAAWDRFGEQFLWRVNDNPDGIVFRARVMTMLLTLVLGAFVFRWASELRGVRAGLLALALYSLDPNVLAHGMLATTDLGVTLFIFAAIYALWRATQSGNRRWFATTGVLTGLALVSKYSALALVPILAALLFLHLRRTRSIGRLTDRSLLITDYLLLILAPAAAIVLAAYLFRIDLYAYEFGFLLAHTETHPSFLLGQRSIEGWWVYFLVTFFLKTPLPLLLLIGIAVVFSIRRRIWRAEVFLLVPALFYFAFSVASGFNVGYRHLLPVVPFLLVYASQVAQSPDSSPVTRHPPPATRHPSPVTRHASTYLLSALILWLALSSFISHPDYIAYFNEAAPQPRYNVLVDSNLDWGQSLKQLRGYLDANGIERVKLSYFGTADPAAYGVGFDPLPRWPPPRQTDFVPANPAPGVYAISASNLQGILLDDPSAFDWFRHRRPDAIVGQSILVYHVGADPNPPQAVGLCREPWTPIADEQVDTLFGRHAPALRAVRFDCANSWWQPSVPAWYVVPRNNLDWPFGLTEYEHRRKDDSLVYRVYRRDPAQQVAQIARDPITPARFEGGLTLLGFTWSGDWKVGGTIGAESAWQVDAPPAPPVSIFAHLLDPAGVLVAGSDGFGVPAELLRPGDLIVRRHQFELSPDAPAGNYTVEFGFYRLDTLARYLTVVDGQPADRIWSQPFRVTK